MNSFETTQLLLGELAALGLNGLTSTANNVFGQLVESVTGSLNNLLGNLQGLLGKRASHPSIQNIISQIESAVQSLSSLNLGSLEGIFNTFQQQIGSFLTNITKPQARSALLAASQQAKGEIADAFNAILNETLGHLTNIATSLANVGLASILTALNGKRGLFDGFGDILNGLTSTLSGHIDNITSSLVTVGSSLLDAVTPHLQDLQDQLTNHALNAAQSLLSTLANISGTLSGKRGIFDDLLAQVSGTISSLTSSLQSTGSALLGAVTPHLQDLQDQLTNHALNAAQSLLGTLANISGTLSG